MPFAPSGGLASPDGSAVGNGLGEVFLANPLLCIKVRESARHLEDAVNATWRQRHARGCAFEQLAPGFPDRAVAIQQFAAKLRIEAALSRESNFPRRIALILLA